MIDFAAALVEALLGSNGDTPQGRAYDGSKRAWRQADGVASTTNLPFLRRSFKHASAPGAYVDPDGAALAPWIESWRDGLTPREARRRARRELRSHR